LGRGTPDFPHASVSEHDVPAPPKVRATAKSAEFHFPHGGPAVTLTTDRQM